ncbi:hypothetical protein ECANGB1_1250 [Enterospora canceri]|uniref:Uncharacterized protein n=1 Tax=Enterospora canceri TaxID=1081671 RepID=A0A1Y1S6J8_9MICR|nr:hypothetical protein ECANGB1_1250 [Enterospora canceri]
MFCLLISRVFCEVFLFKDYEPLVVNFRLAAENISTGAFRLYPNNQAKFKVDIVTDNHEKKFFGEDIEDANEKHFSFSNKAIEDVAVKITPYHGSMDSDPAKNRIYMKFESKLNTFDATVSLKKQIEPAVYALNRLVQKLQDVIETTKNASRKTSQLEKEHKRMFVVVVFLSFVSLVGYTVFNIVQISLMRKYLHDKKYL